MIFILALITIIIIVISFQNWRNACKATLYIVVLEGILRKWFLPQASDFIYLLKDIVLVGVYLRFFLEIKHQISYKNRIFYNDKSIKLLLSFNFAWCLLQVFNPSSPSIIVGLFGLKAYFFYVPLIWILPNIFESEAELYYFIRNYLLLLIPVALLGIVQFFAPSSSFLNIYAGGQEATATFSGFVRITGTFSYLAGYTIYLSFCLCLLIPILTLTQSKINRILSLIEVLLLVGTSFMTGARSLIIFELLLLTIYIIIFIILSPYTVKNFVKQMQVPLILIAIIVPRYFSQAIDAFTVRLTSNSLLSDSRISEPFLDPLYALQYINQYNGFDSYGTGTNHQGFSALARLFDLNFINSLPPWESEMGRIVLEIGLFGFIFWYGFRLFLLFALWKTFLKLKTYFLKQLALCAFLFQLIHLTGHLVFNHIFSVYYWFLTGFIFLLPKLEATENYQSPNFK